MLNFWNSTIQVTSYEYSPFSVPHVDPRNGNIYWTGLCMDILDALASSFNFRYVVVEPGDNQYGALMEDGNWTGMIGMLVRKEVDFAASGITITYERSSAVAFLTPFWEEPQAFVINLPREDTISKCFRPFSIGMWLCIGGAILLSGFLLWSFSHSTQTLVTSCFNSFSSIVLQGWHKEPEIRSARLYFALWWLVCIALGAVYSGNLMANLTVTKYTLPVNSLDDLVKNADYGVGINKGTAVETLLKRAPLGSTYNLLWEKLKDSNGILGSSVDFFMHRVRTEKFALISDYSYLLSLTNKDCNLVIPKERFFKGNFGIAARKDFPYIKEFNEKIAQILEAGLIEKWLRKYDYDKDLCAIKATDVSAKSIELPDTSGAFLLLGTGIAASFFTLFLERLWSNLCKLNNMKSSEVEK